MSFEVVGDPRRELNSRPTADIQIVTPGFFHALEIPMVRGRAFTDRDTPDGQPVCIVNEAFVRDVLKGREAIGMRVALRRVGALESREPIVREIVGVVRQVKGLPVELEQPIDVYVPLGQDVSPSASLVVRPASGTADALVPTVRVAIARVDTSIPLTRVRTMGDIAWHAASPQRFRAVLVVVFGGLALVLAMVGVFGVLAYSVQQRTREFGVRIALGASGPDVLRMVLGSAARVIGAGTVVGLALAGLLANSLAAFLFGVRPIDPLTFGAVAIVLTATAAIAAMIPARRCPGRPGRSLPQRITAISDS